MREDYDLAAIILEKLRSRLPSTDFIALHEPRFNGNEWNYVKECLDTGWVSSVGKYVDLFEKMLMEFTGAKHAVAVVNGTAALHISLLLAGVEAGDEVLMPSLTFIATANAVAYCGATPHFIDSEEKTLGIDVNKLATYLSEVTVIKDGYSFNKITGKRIKAIVPMHTFGHPVDLDALVEICEQFHLSLVEDAAESLGSYYKGKHTGNWGITSAVSFNGNKVITTGGGGAILTNDPELARMAKHITTTAKIPHKWKYMHDHIGYNYRLPNLNAALGCAQLEQLPHLLDAKRELASKYASLFADVDGVKFLTEPEACKSNYWLNALIIDEQYSSQLDYILGLINDNGIMTRPIWKLIHSLDMYTGCPKMDLSNAESLEGRVINIPSSPFLNTVFTGG